MDAEIKNIKKDLESLKRAVEELKIAVDIEPEVRPEYLKKLREIEKGKHFKFKDIDDLRKQIEGWNDPLWIFWKIAKILYKLSKKNYNLYNQILKKIKEITNSENIEHYKNLRYDLKEFKGVHVGHFVLVFKYDKNRQLISFEDFDHHDKIYFKRY